MERDIEKSDIARPARTAFASAMDALAVVSVVAAFLGAALSAAGGSWRLAAYASIVGVLFDLVFTYESLARLARGERPVPWIALLSSALPLLLVSGPFLAGWLLADLEAAAVRGFSLGVPPLGGLSAFAALRALRVARPFRAPRRPGRAGGRPGTRTNSSGLMAAASAGAVIALAGAVASETLAVPGLALASRARRSSAMAALASAGDDAARVAAAEASGAVALRVSGRVLVAAPADIAPSDYVALASGGCEAWFSVAAETRARSAAAALTALVGLGAAAAYAAALRATPARGGRRGADGATPGADGAPARREGLADKPTGTEEIVGILGKRPR